MRFAWILVVVAVLGCGNKQPAPRAADDGGNAPTAPLDAPPPGDGPITSADALWQAYQGAHAGANQRNLMDVGRRLDALLSEEARTLITDASAEAVGALPTTLSIHGADIRFKLLGEGAVARAALIGAATAATTPVDGRHARITVTSGVTTLTLLAVEDGGAWRFDPAPDLLAREDQVFALPAGQAAPAGAATAAIAAANWIVVLNRGTGWDAYNQLAPSNRTRLKELVATMGGAGDEDVVRILEKTIRDRRDRGIVARTFRLSGCTATRCDVTFEYSTGSDDLELAHEDGAWWMVLPL